MRVITTQNLIENAEPTTSLLWRHESATDPSDQEEKELVQESEL